MARRGRTNPRFLVVTGVLWLLAALLAAAALHGGAHWALALVLAAGGLVWIRRASVLTRRRRRPAYRRWPRY